MRSVFIALIISLLVIPLHSRNDYSWTWEDVPEDNAKSHFPDNEFLKVGRDFFNKVQKNKYLEKLKQHAQKAVRIGEEYSVAQFHTDIENGYERMDIFKLVAVTIKGLWALVVHTFVHLFHFADTVQRYVFNFLRGKLDDTLGNNSEYHPFVVMSAGNKKHIEFYVFVLLLAVLFTIGRFLSWLEYLSVIAASFLVYSYGGSLILFKLTLFIIGVIWLSIDTVMTYPLEAACLILTIFVSNFIRDRVSHSTAGPYPSNAVYNNQQPSPRTTRHASRADILQMDQRIMSMESKTDLLNDRLERLSNVIERLAAQSDD